MCLAFSSQFPAALVRVPPVSGRRNEDARPEWASDPRLVRERFEEKMTDEAAVVTRRIREYLVPRFNEWIERLKRRGDLDDETATRRAADACSEILLDARDDVMEDYESGLASGLTAEARAQKTMQAGKSNAGKIFERFSAYAVSRALTDTEWAVWKDTADLEDVIGLPKAELLSVTRRAFGRDVNVLLEADYIVFRPENPEQSLVFVSTKSSMKDRLHNVTMWAILLDVLRSDDAKAHLQLDAVHLETLRNSRYVLVTGDIAAEQPDLRGKDARELLQFDASFCDAAFAAVTEEWNASLPGDVRDVDTRDTAFYRLSALPTYLEALAAETEAT